MTTLPLAVQTETSGNRMIQQQLQDDVRSGADRREHRRYDMEQQSIRIDRWEGASKSQVALGQVVDLSAGGVRIRTTQANLKADRQIRVRLELPVFSGICPFVDTTGGHPIGKREWVGWMAVARVEPTRDGGYEVAGRLVDMEEIDRGMLGLYLSTQPLAA
jgi:hypothetical protein